MDFNMLQYSKAEVRYFTDTFRSLHYVMELVWCITKCHYVKIILKSNDLFLDLVEYHVYDT